MPAKLLWVPSRLPWAESLVSALVSSLVAVHFAYLPFMAFGKWLNGYTNVAENLTVTILVALALTVGSLWNKPLVPLLGLFGCYVVLWAIIGFQTVPAYNYGPFALTIVRPVTICIVSYALFCWATSLRVGPSNVQR